MKLFYKRKKEISRLGKVLEGEVNSMAELILKSGIAYEDIKNYQREGLINLPWRWSFRKKFGRGKIGDHIKWFDTKIREVREDKSYQSVADEFKREFGETISREYVRQYVKVSDQKSIWKDSRNLARRIKQSLVDILRHYTIEKAGQEGYKEAVIYYFGNHRRHQINLGIRIDRVRMYKEAKARLGRDLSFTEIRDLFGSTLAQSIETNLRAMRLTRREQNIRRVTPEEKKEAIKRVYGLDYLNSSDIGYFLDVLPEVAHYYLKRVGRRDWQKRIKRFGRCFDLLYKDASQVYGFKDEFGASNYETAEAIGKPLEVVEYALEHRGEIEPRLIHALRVMFPKERITTGYR